METMQHTYGKLIHKIEGHLPTVPDTIQTLDEELERMAP
jgi:hypothetical protein